MIKISHSIKLFYILTLSLIWVCCSSEKEQDIDPSTYLTDTEIDSFKYSIIRYVGKLAGKADHTTKFDTIFDEYYLALAEQHDLLFYYKHPSQDTVYFCLTRIAPSIHLKKVSIGGKLVAKENSIEYFEESFRTYKMVPEDLSSKSRKIFIDYITRRDLSKYLYTNSQPDEFIEFPNEEVYYDLQLRQWLTTREDPLEPYYHLKNSDR